MRISVKPEMASGEGFTAGVRRSSVMTVVEISLDLRVPPHLCDFLSRHKIQASANQYQILSFRPATVAATLHVQSPVEDYRR
jgi:hypothetical protein